MAVVVLSSSLEGIDARLIYVEADSFPGLHTFHIVGLPDASVRESQDRISSAIRNSGFKPPSSFAKRFVINLAPSDVKKEGSSFDLPIAIAFLLETRQITCDTRKFLIMGELALDGKTRYTRGCLAAILLAQEAQIQKIIIPLENVDDARMAQNHPFFLADSLSEAIKGLEDDDGSWGNTKTVEGRHNDDLGQESKEERSHLAHGLEMLSKIQGQQYAKRALTIAATGGHNILMIGPPGAGKTLLIQCLPFLLPRLSKAEQVEVSKIYGASLQGSYSHDAMRPFRSPHHTATLPSIYGGASLKPGEVSLSHNGVLFLDEACEFRRNVIDALRQPLENHKITVSRAKFSYAFPARFILALATNPCPCGYYGTDIQTCQCTNIQVRRYREKLSGPLLDRIDIQVSVPRETSTLKANSTLLHQNQELLKSIVEARETQRIRNATFGDTFLRYSNSFIPHHILRKVIRIDREAEHLLGSAADAKRLSLRATHKMMRVARTIADLEGSEEIKSNHVSEALQLRSRDN